jgi:hypothetical protein
MARRLPTTELDHRIMTRRQALQLARKPEISISCGDIGGRDTARLDNRTGTRAQLDFPREGAMRVGHALDRVSAH